MKTSFSIFQLTFKLAFTVVGCCMFMASANAQSNWSLQKCIEHAKENSLTLKQANYNVQLAALSDKQNRMSRMPNLNGSSNFGYQFGLSVDPTTNTLKNQRIGFNNLGVNANLPIYNGGQINNTIKQGKYNLKASEADASFAFNNMSLNIANAYLQILMAEEQLTNAKKRLELSQEQLDQTDKMIRAGTLPENDRLEVLAQMARDEQTIIQSQNSIDINYLNLKEFMQLDPSTEIKVEFPDDVNVELSVNPETYAFNDIYSTALSTQPQVMRDEMNLKSAEVGVDIARGNMLPTLTLFGGMDTRWSSKGQRVAGEQQVDISESVLVENNPVTITRSLTFDVYEDAPYFNQLRTNFGQQVGVSLNLPIYNNHRNQIGVERAKVNILNSKLQSDLTKQQLKIDVQNALASARAAYRNLAAANKSVDAAQAAFGNAEKQYELGAINTFQYTTARNNLDRAEIDATVAKYDYLFRLKIIDFYLGKELKLN